MVSNPEVIFEQVQSVGLMVSAVMSIQSNNKIAYGAQDSSSPALSLLDLLTQLDLFEVPKLSAVLGVTEDERPLLMRLPAPSMGNVLIMGDRGCGKSALLQSLVISLALLNPQRHLQFALLDWNDSLEALADLPHLLTPIISDLPAALDLLAYLQEQRADQVSEPAIVVAVDDLCQWGDELALALADFAQHGREMGVYVVCSLTQPFSVNKQLLERAGFIKLFGQLANPRKQRQVKADGIGVDGLSPGEFVVMMPPESVRFWGAFAAPQQVSELSSALWEWSGVDLLRYLHSESQLAQWEE